MNHLFYKIKNSKNHWYVLILLILSFAFFHNIISTTKVLQNIHYVNDISFYSYNMMESLKNHELPLWTPYFYSGRPLFAQAEYYFINVNFLLVWLTGNIYLAMNFTAIIHLFLAGLGMFLLVSFLTESRHASFISAFAYMFSGYMHTFVVPGNLNILEGYSLIPFLFLFIIRALKGKRLVIDSIIAGIFIALEIFVGGVIFLPYIFILIAVYAIIYAANKNFPSRIIKLAIVGILIFTVGFCLSAIKLLPGIEFLNLSNRGAGLPYQEFIGSPIQLKNFAYTFITTSFLQGDNLSGAIGIVGFLLLIFGMYKFRNHIVLFSILTILLSLAISTESFVSRALYHVPIINQTRHIERSVVMFTFAASILAGIGFVNLQSLIERHEKIKLKKNLVFFLIIFLLFFELFLLHENPSSMDVVKPGKIPILDYMGKDTTKFRTINNAMSTLIGASGYNYYSQFGISEIKGGSGVWFNDYLTYLSVAQNAPAKFWGILNDKYVIQNKNDSLDGLRYIGKFDACEGCYIWEAYGPYLYENTKYLPRYYTVPNSVLVLGDGPDFEKFVYFLMLQNFEPKNTVLIESPDISNFDAKSLKKFNYIFLTRGPSQDEIQKLKDYKDSGGVIVPDILVGKNKFSADDAISIFNKTAGSFKEIKAGQYQNNKVVLDLNGETGWLVASERFAYFPGWDADINGETTRIFHADGAVSAVYLDGSKEKLTFEYKPNPYRTGKLISIISFVLVLGYFVYAYYRKKSNVGDKNQA